MNFLGHTRFSVMEPKSPSWRLSRASGRTSVEDYTTSLFSEARLKERSEIFFTYSLPLLDAAKGEHKVLHVVSFSHHLPLKYKAMLYDAEQRYSWLHLDEQRPGSKKTVLDKVAIKFFGEGAIYAEYRLDDDDLLGVSFFDDLIPYVTKENVGSLVSFGLGAQSFFDGSVFVQPRLEHRPKIAIGLTRICEIENKSVIGPRRVAHTKSDLYNPVILDSRSLSFLHTIHRNQDSGVDKPKGDMALRIRNYLNQPRVSVEDLEIVFPGVPFDPKGKVGTRVGDSRKATIREWVSAFSAGIRLLTGKHW